MNIIETKFANGGSRSKLGGAIYCECQGLRLENNSFLGNEAASGGALYLIGLPSTNAIQHYNTKTPSNFTIIGSTFTKNIA